MLTITTLSVPPSMRPPADMLSTANLYNQLCQSLWARGTRVLLVDTNLSPTLCQSDELVHLAAMGLGASLLRGEVCPDALSQFSSMPQGANRRSCLHLLHARDLGDGSDIEERCTSRSKVLKKLLDRGDLRSFYDLVIIDARGSGPQTTLAAVAAADLILTHIPSQEGAEGRGAGRLIFDALGPGTTEPRILPPPAFLKVPTTRKGSGRLTYLPPQLLNGSAKTHSREPGMLLDPVDETINSRVVLRQQSDHSLSKRARLWKLPEAELEEVATVEPDPSLSEIKLCSRWLHVLRDHAGSVLPGLTRVKLPITLGMQGQPTDMESPAALYAVCGPKNVRSSLTTG